MGTQAVECKVRIPSESLIDTALNKLSSRTGRKANVNWQVKLIEIKKCPSYIYQITSPLNLRLRQVAG